MAAMGQTFAKCSKGACKIDWAQWPPGEPPCRSNGDTCACMVIVCYVKTQKGGKTEYDEVEAHLPFSRPVGKEKPSGFTKKQRKVHEERAAKEHLEVQMYCSCCKLK